MVDHFTARGGELKMNARVKDIVLNDDGSVKHYKLTTGEVVEGDLYMSAMPGGLHGGWVAAGLVDWARGRRHGQGGGERGELAKEEGNWRTAGGRWTLDGGTGWLAMLRRR